jgi:pimeloyl-ACP methyl ester carboxylesterase
MPQSAGIFYFAYGTENVSRPPTVLIHGAGGTHLHWSPQARRIPGQRIYAIDLPGHGKSGGVGSQSIDEYARSVVNFLDELKFNTAVIVGHSMGSAIALKMALDFPKRVIGLGLVGSGARLRVAREILDGSSSAATFPAVVKLINDLGFGSSVSPRMKELAAQRMAEIRPAVLHGDFAACDGFDVISRLGEISVPTMILCGAEDVLTPVKYSEFLREHIAGARLVAFPGAGHMVMVEQPEAFAKALGNFVDAIVYQPGK